MNSSRCTRALTLRCHIQRLGEALISALLQLPTELCHVIAGYARPAVYSSFKCSFGGTPHLIVADPSHPDDLWVVHSDRIRGFHPVPLYCRLSVPLCLRYTQGFARSGDALLAYHHTMGCLFSVLLFSDRPASLWVLWPAWSGDPVEHYLPSGFGWQNLSRAVLFALEGKKDDDGAQPTEWPTGASARFLFGWPGSYGGGANLLYHIDVSRKPNDADWLAAGFDIKIQRLQCGTSGSSEAWPCSDGAGDIVAVREQCSCRPRCSIRDQQRSAYDHHQQIARGAHLQRYPLVLKSTMLGLQTHNGHAAKRNKDVFLYQTRDKGTKKQEKNASELPVSQPV